MASAAQQDLDIGIGGGSDPFATGAKGRGKIHVRIQQRNGRKCITTIQGLDEDLDLGRMMKNMKKNCAWAYLMTRVGREIQGVGIIYQPPPCGLCL
jgi:translation initiation factor SUI1